MPYMPSDNDIKLIINDGILCLIFGKVIINFIKAINVPINISIAPNNAKIFANKPDTGSFKQAMPKILNIKLLIMINLLLNAGDIDYAVFYFLFCFFIA